MTMERGGIFFPPVINVFAPDDTFFTDFRTVQYGRPHPDNGVVADFTTVENDIIQRLHHCR